MTVTTEDIRGQSWSSVLMECKGVHRKVIKRAHAEHAAAKLFLADPGVQHTAVNLNAAYLPHATEK